MAKEKKSTQRKRIDKTNTYTERKEETGRRKKNKKKIRKRLHRTEILREKRN